MRTKNRLITNLTVGFLGACIPLIGCSGEEATSGTGGTAGSVAGTPATGGSVTGGTSTGGAVTGGTSTGGTATGGVSGSVTGGSTTGGSGGAGVTGGSGGAGTGGGGTGGASGGTGGAGSGGMSGGSGGAGGMAGAAGRAGGGAGGAGGSSSGTFTLTSPDHMDGAMFAAPYTCDNPMGFNGSILPELRWSGAPAGTMSFAITFIDRTLAPANMNGYHWVIWNIPAATMMLPEGFKDQASIMAQENRDFLGPCPNFSGSGTVTDEYEFTIYALAQASITVTPATGTMAVANAETMLEANNLGKAVLGGTSNASPGN